MLVWPLCFKSESSGLTCHWSANLEWAYAATRFHVRIPVRGIALTIFRMVRLIPALNDQLEETSILESLTVRASELGMRTYLEYRKAPVLQRFEDRQGRSQFFRWAQPRGSLRRLQTIIRVLCRIISRVLCRTITRVLCFTIIRVLCCFSG